MNKIVDYYLKSWRAAVLMLCLGAVAFILYFHRLSTLLPGYASIEISTLHSASDWHTIASNPINAPYKICLWLLTAVHHSGLQATRLVSAAFATLSGLLFFAILRMRSHFYMALLGTILYITSAGLMHYGRLGTPEIMQAGVLALMAAVLYYQHSQARRILAGYGLVALLVVLCYIPGLIWFELFGVVLLQTSIRRQVVAAPFRHQVGWGLIGATLLAPLATAVLGHPTLLRTLAGLPNNLGALTHFASNLGSAFLTMGIRSDGNPLYNVSHVPLLNVVELILCALGLYAHIRLERSNRSVFLIGSIVLSLLLISLGGAVSFACLVPLLYLPIGRGINYLAARWFTVFPRNPIAKGTAVVLICILLFFSVLYQVRSYFVAWPNSAPTKQVFNRSSHNS